MQTDIDVTQDPSLVSCLNCSKHSASRIEQTLIGTIFCELSGWHVWAKKAENCAAFPTYKYPEKANDKAAADKTVEQTTLVATEPDSPKVVPTWTPQSALDSAVPNFNDTTLAAGFRAMYDLMKAMNQRLDVIEAKMPSTHKWKVKSYLGRKKSALKQKASSQKWKIKRFIRKLHPPPAPTPTPAATEEKKEETNEEADGNPIFS